MTTNSAGQNSTSRKSSPAALLALVSAICAVVASFGVLLSATDPKIALDAARIDAEQALARSNYSWASVEIKDGIAYIKGEAPGEPERIMAYESVRRALQPAIRETQVVEAIRSHLTLAAKPEADPGPVVAAAEPAIPTPPARDWSQSTTVAAADVEAVQMSKPGPAPAAAPSANELKNMLAAASVPLSPTATAAAAAAPQPANQIETASVEKTPVGTDCKTELSNTLTSSKIVFAPNSATIAKESTATLDKLAAIARTCGKQALTIEGHTDETGTNTRNKSLSEERAYAVRNELIRRGIPRGKLRAMGYGARKPIAAGSTEAARAQNRRIEISVSSATSDTRTARK